MADETGDAEASAGDELMTSNKEEEQQQEEEQEEKPVTSTMDKQAEAEPDDTPPAKYNKADDAMAIDFDESQWLSCVPDKFGLSLAKATFIGAIIGAGVGIALALADPTVTTTTVTEMVCQNMTGVFNSSMEYDEFYDVYDDNGVTMVSYCDMVEEDVMEEVMTEVTAVFNSSMVYDDIIDVYEEDGETMVSYYVTEEQVMTVETEEPVLSDEWQKIIAFPGNLWVRALKLLVLPLIILMMVILPSRVDEIGYVAARAVPLYLFTSTCAAIQGTCWAWIIRPGEAGEQPSDVGTRSSDEDITEMDALLNAIYNMVPSNIVDAMANLRILGCICFFLAIGVLLRKESVKKVERDCVLNFSKAILRCCMMAVIYVIWFTPIGMCSLVMIKLATTNDIVSLMAALGFYILTVVVGHSVHLFGFYPAVFFATTRGNGWKWFAKIYEAPMLAFATSSSAATLPRSIQVAEKAGVRKEISDFILPLGAAINMDGTALGFPIMIGLIAQLNEVSLDAGTVITIMLLSVVISVGTAPIPNAGMVYLTMLFEAAGMGDLAGEGLATLFVLDWFVDRVETAVNVTSDQFVCKIIDDVSRMASAKNVKVSLGCCLGPNSGYTQQREVATPTAQQIQTD